MTAASERPASGTIDIESLSAWLGETLPEAGPLRAATPVAGGQSNPTFRLDCEHAALALRKQPPGPLLPSAHRIDREWKFLRGLSAVKPPSVPVPRPLAWCGDASLLGTPFYVMAWVDGHCFATPALDGLDADTRGYAYGAAFETLAALHGTDPAAAGLEGMGRPEGFTARLTARWSQQYEASAHRDIAPMNELMRELAAWDPGHAVAIVHGDYRMANLIFAPDCSRILALVDWELASVGHPMTDLAYACAGWRCGPDTPGFDGVSGLDLEAMGIPSERQALETYREAGGADVPGDWEMWMAQALFRMAAIAQGIYRRGLQGQASSRDWERFGPAVEALAMLGVEALEKGRHAA